MRKISFIAVFFIAKFLNAQPVITPTSDIIEKQWVKNTSYKMNWYLVKDTAKFEIGNITTSIIIKNDSLIAVTKVNMKQSESPWIDSTIANVADLSPVYHSSYNAQREMVLHFGKTVTGFYNDKIRHEFRNIADTTDTAYFDSNIYPLLITWLPLHENYQQFISIYDYNPASKTGVIKALIRNVKKGALETKSSGVRNVWIVSVSDEISGLENGVTTFYIDAADRKLWKQQIEAGGRTMEMELTEM